ncbi:MAG: beta-glucosidase BglX [Chitinophagaceae bacterium]|nr:beta-glucosidase BglX [Chitinophagaceae bacterium]
MKRIPALIIMLCCTGICHAQTKTMDAYIRGLMQKMTAEEKIGQLNLVTPGGAVTGSVVSSDVDNKIRKGQVGGLFGITGPAKIRQAQEIAVKNTRLHIPLIFGLDVIHGHKTILPVPLGLSCSWDTAMIERTAQLAAREATADGLNWVYSPMVDIARDPRWGRIAEGSGEDPYLGSRIAAAMVRGYQGSDLSKNNTVLACVKHYALYGAAEGGRDYNTTDMSRIRMYEYYLPPYKAAIDAGAGSIMTSFNEVDAVPATENKFLLDDVLTRQWGFKGLVVTDYTSLNEMIAHGTGDLQEVSARALNAGVHMDMVGEGFLTTLKKSLAEKKVTLQQIDNACRKVLEAKYKLGLFDDPFRYCDTTRAATEILTDSTRAAARIFATHSFVLLKNKNHVLPLKNAQTIALVGPLADSRINMLGTWSVSGDATKSISLKQGLENAVNNKASLLYAKGANLTDDTAFAKRVNAFSNEAEIDKRSADEMLAEALGIAAKADVIVAALGEAADMTGESSSMSNISLQEAQQKLLKALVATGKPVVLVLFNGRPMTLPWEDAHASAILDVWFGGTEAGNAIADVLFGKYNPSGKLSVSFPVNVGQIPVYYNHKNTGRPFNGDVSSAKFKSDYLDVSNDPLYPFGYGLSYTDFLYGDIKMSKTSVKGNEKITASVNIKNTGNYKGEETVQLYISDPVASVTRSVKDLKGFQKVTLNPGASKDISFTITTNELKFFNSGLEYDWEPGKFIIHIGGNSRDLKSAEIDWEK